MRFSLLAILLLGLVGCASPRLVQGPAPSSVEALNVVLEGRTVTIETADGRRITKPIDVEVVGDEVPFRKRRSAAREEGIPLREVERITYREGGGAGTGAVIMALPGGFFTLVGLAGAVQAEGDSLNASVGYLVAVAGGGVALVGAIVGAVIGSVVAPGQPLEGARPTLPAPPAPQLEVPGW